MSDDNSHTSEVPLYRFRVAAGLRELATFIERNPALPIPNYLEISLSVFATSDQEERDEIDRIAEILGTPATFPYGPHHYTASREFGPVVFRAVCISEEYMRQHKRKLDLIDVIDANGVITGENWPV